MFHQRNNTLDPLNEIAILRMLAENAFEIRNILLKIDVHQRVFLVNNILPMQFAYFSQSCSRDYIRG